LKISKAIRMEAGIILCLIMVGGSFAIVMSSPLMLEPSGKYNVNGVSFNYVEFDRRFVYLDFDYKAIDGFDTYTHIVPVVDFGNGNVYAMGDYPVGRVVFALNEPANMAGDIKAVNIYGYDARHDSDYRVLIISLNALELRELAG